MLCEEIQVPLIPCPLLVMKQEGVPGYTVSLICSDFLCAQLTNGYHFTFPVNPSILVITLSDERTSQIQNNVFSHIKHQVTPQQGIPAKSSLVNH